MLRKITRILFKTTGMVVLVLLLLVIGLYFAVQSYTFQTWLGQKTGSYLAEELHTSIQIESVQLDFFKQAKLKGVYIEDLHHDTLLSGDIDVTIKTLDYKNQKIELADITLKNVSANLIQYKRDTSLNLQFLIDYFSGSEKKSDNKPGWDFKPGNIFLDNVSFVFKNENKDTAVSQNINFDNLVLTHTSGKIKNLQLLKDTIVAEIIGLKANEQSGFVLQNLSAKAKVSPKELKLEALNLKTADSYLKGNIQFLYNDWSDYSDFINKIEMRAELSDSTQITSKDIAAFAPELNGLNKTLYLSGKVRGYVSDLNLSDFNLRYGNHTAFKGNLTLSGLPDMASVYVHLDAKQITTHYNDLITIPSYPFSEGNVISIPDQIKPLGLISYKGKFDGFLNDFIAYGSFKTALGTAVTDLRVKLGKKTDDIAYSGSLKTVNFNLGALLGVKDLSQLSLNTSIKGKGLSLKSLDVDMEGKIVNLHYNGYDYKDILLNGSIEQKVFTGLVTSKDPNADFDFNGTISFKTKVPQMDFISTINNIDFQKLNFTKEQASLSTQVLMILNGDNLNNFTGTINFDNTVYHTNNKQYKISTFDLQLDQETADKKINLNSSYFNLAVAGKFNILNMPGAVNQLLHAYYPAFFEKNKGRMLYTDALKMQLTVKKFDVIKELFVKNLMLSPGMVITGDFDAAKNLISVTSKSDSIRVGSMKFNNNVIESYSQNNKINLVFKGSSIQLSDSIKLPNYFMYLVSKNQDTKFNVEWDNKLKPKNAGKIAGKFSFINSQATFNLDQFFITGRDSTWKMVVTNPTIIDSTGITINPLLFTSKNQKIGIAGKLSDRVGDSLLVSVDSVILQQFNPLLNMVSMDVQGELKGKAIIFKHEKHIAFASNFAFDDLKLNNNHLGDLTVETTYDPKNESVHVDGFTSLGLIGLEHFGNRNISFNGYYYMNRKEESIDIDFACSPANLRLLNPFIEGILTINNAYVVGQGKVHGSPSDIKVDGKLKLVNSEIKVDYTNVTYFMTGTIEIMPDQIRFSEIVMRDNPKAAPTGTINGNIFHNNFKRIQLDYDITYRNMMVLNTTAKENKTFYGRIYGKGNIGIWGFLNNLHMEVRDTTTKGSKFILPLDGPSEVEESDFITFVKKDTVKVKPEEPLTGFNLDMYISATPDAQMQIILDGQAGDVLNVQGAGNLLLKINTLGKFEMLGDYIIEQGDYLFTLENVVNKKFDIDEGSSISWSGDPLGAEIDVSTSYRQRASVAPLLNDTTGAYKGRFPVDCKLKIRNKLFSPIVTFAIDFPTVDATARARINNILSDEAELNRQVFSFLLFRSFITPQIYNNNTGGVTAGNAAASTGSEMLSNRLSSFLNSYVGNITGLGDLELGLNYRPGSQNNGDAVDLALSKQLFNNKVSIDGNFGVNNNTAGTHRNSSGIIDVNIEYKLTDDGRYRLKGFNRSNDTKQITTMGGPYTQGIGVFYREEFETWNQLLKKYLEKMKKQQEQLKKDPAN